MSDYTRIRIEETKRIIALNEETQKKYPGPAIEMNLQSLRKMLLQMESELAAPSLPAHTIETSQPFPESNCIPPKAP